MHRVLTISANARKRIAFQTLCADLFSFFLFRNSRAAPFVSLCVRLAARAQQLEKIKALIMDSQRGSDTLRSIVGKKRVSVRSYQMIGPVVHIVFIFEVLTIKYYLTSCSHVA